MKLSSMRCRRAYRTTLLRRRYRKHGRKKADKLGGLPEDASPEVSCYVPEHSDQIRVEFVIPCEKGDFKVFINYSPDGSLYNYVIWKKRSRIRKRGIFMSDFVIETKKLTKIYGEQTAVSSVDIHVKPGRIYGLLGRNGAGKTTIMKRFWALRQSLPAKWMCSARTSKAMRNAFIPVLGLSSKLPAFTRT